jgi:hypothetical protein
MASIANEQYRENYTDIIGMPVFRLLNYIGKFLSGNLKEILNNFKRRNPVYDNFEAVEMSTSFTLQMSKTKIDDFAICTVYKFDTVYRKIPIYRKFRYIG